MVMILAHPKHHEAMWTKATRIAAGYPFTNLLGVNPKIIKSNKAGKGYLTRIMHLAPAWLSGYNVCSFASEECIRFCLNSAGNPVYYYAKEKARIARTRFLFEHPQQFRMLLDREIGNAMRAAIRAAARLAFRPNGTSDMLWEIIHPDLFARWPDVTFYDYTKVPKRWDLPDNYSLTFSRSEKNEDACEAEFQRGRNVAVAMDLKPSEATPTMWRGRPAFDADINDLRFRDPQRPSGYWACLRTKGKLRGSTRRELARTGSRGNGFAIFPG